MGGRGANFNNKKIVSIKIRVKSINGTDKETPDLPSEFQVHRSLSAMAKRFYVKSDKPMREEGWYIKEGSSVTGVKAIASGEKIRDIERLISENPLEDGKFTHVKDWYKVRGTATVTNGKQTYKNCEVHWYQCKNVGKIEFKVKEWGELE